MPSGIIETTVALDILDRAIKSLIDRHVYEYDPAVNEAVQILLKCIVLIEEDR